MAILRLLLIVFVVFIVGAFVMGYLSGPNGYSLSRPTTTDSSETVARARETGAAIGEKAGAAATRVGETLDEASITTKIKAKMALDDVVKARAIDVTTRGTTVTLSGTVATKAEHDRAMSLARETEGVSQVIDNMRVG